MKMFTVFCLSALASVAYGNSLKVGGFSAYPNTEFGFGSQTVQIGFRGYPDVTDDIEIKLYKVTKEESSGALSQEVEDAVATFTITEQAEKSAQAVLTLPVPDSEIPASESVNTKLYAVKICKKGDASTCSDFSPSGKVDFGLEKKLDCEEVDATLTNIAAEPLMGYVDSTVLGKISTDDDSTMKIQGYAEGKYRQQKLVGSNWMLYFVFKMNLKPYAAMLNNPGRNFYCSRKYTPSILTFIIDQTTKKVERVFKFTPVLTQPAAAALAAKDSFPLEVEHTVGTEKITGQKAIWHTLCFTDKDLVGGAVKCTTPYRQKDESGNDIAWDIKKDTIDANGNTEL